MYFSSCHQVLQVLSTTKYSEKIEVVSFMRIRWINQWTIEFLGGSFMICDEANSKEISGPSGNFLWWMNVEINVLH